ncbi:phosphate:Na+ symporter [Caminicella sporogenes DSM 14501]|uniref:Phosphate:Na+ symporter n=1 Tax=Caminicella sporogenes DSM 14501 TaxID=1121266 RepID=A0A1M6MSL6_9FIRM|nr:Na/Pi cotransporter family protein [Caminicella sporogenes]RKD22522.1 sodium-dependent phosphate transporter [Caminicella sporogenes]SHJ86402.1 phosphate:Na+ symporter [Caminicella sporogenes DSM 14501]
MEIFFGLIGGLGLFLYGMNVMAAGLEKSAGDKMKKIIEVLTSNRIMGVLVGAVVTMIVQSSSATTVMVVGFVNAGIMSLTQAVGIIMGANIGTTITAQLASINFTEIAPVSVGIGVGIWLFSSNRKVKNVAEILIGFGILFIGMHFMKDAVNPLRQYEGFTNLLLSFGGNNISDKALAILSGFAVTAIIQSSSATTGLLIALASQGLLPIESAFPVVLGTNIGTCVTAMISSIGANKTAKRAALVHMLFNVIGTVLFIIFLANPTIKIVTSMSDDPARQLANAHTLFNIANTLILLPFASILVYIVKKIIPYDPNEEKEIQGIKYLDERILETPSVAMVQVMKEVLHMGNVTLESYGKAMEAFFKADEKIAAETFKFEKIINEMEREIANYLLKISNTEISSKQREIIDGLFNTINDIERVGDHADNLAELAVYRVENKLKFSDEAISELTRMHERVVKSYKEALTALKTGDTKIAQRVVEREGEIDLMEKNLRANHISRLSKQQCIPTSGVIFLDIISNLERIADHASNIALAVIDANR